MKRGFRLIRNRRVFAETYAIFLVFSGSYIKKCRVDVAPALRGRRVDVAQMSREILRWLAGFAVLACPSLVRLGLSLLT
ncbi:MAG: hypothetical protein ACK5U4_09135, partial [Rhodospirillales bacterium]